MYKVASQKAQDAARRLKLAELCDRDFEPSDAERRENLVLKMKAIQVEIDALPPKHPRRAELGQEKFQLQEQVRAIGPKWKMLDMTDYIIKTVRSQVTKHQWAMWLKMAEKMKRDAEALAAEENERQRNDADLLC